MEGFEEFYAAAFGRLVAQVFLVTGDLREAEDVVQEAFVRAAGRWTRLRTYDVPEHWVRRVAINLAISRYRRLQRRVALLVRLGPAPVAPPISVEGLAVAEALGRLPRAQRQAVVLHHLLDLPVVEVARQLGVPVGTVKSRLARARVALAGSLATSIEPVEGVRPEHG